MAVILGDLVPSKSRVVINEKRQLRHRIPEDMLRIFFHLGGITIFYEHILILRQIILPYTTRFTAKDW